MSILPGPSFNLLYHWYRIDFAPPSRRHGPCGKCLTKNASGLAHYFEQYSKKSDHGMFISSNGIDSIKIINIQSLDWELFIKEKQSLHGDVITWANDFRRAIAEQDLEMITRHWLTMTDKKKDLIHHALLSIGVEGLLCTRNLNRDAPVVYIPIASKVTLHSVLHCPSIANLQRCLDRLDNNRRT